MLSLSIENRAFHCKKRKYLIINRCKNIFLSKTKIFVPTRLVHVSVKVPLEFHLQFIAHIIPSYIFGMKNDIFYLFIYFPYSLWAKAPVYPLFPMYKTPGNDGLGLKLLICDETSLIFYQFLINFFLVGRKLLCFLFFFILLFNHIPP